MKNLKSFFASYKKSLETFTQALAKTLIQYEKDFTKQGQDTVQDTLRTAMFNIKFTLEDMHRGILEKAELIQRDLIEPLDLYYKHYSSTNQELIKQGNQFWTTLHQDRTQMLFAKENYHNQMHQMQQLQLQYSEAAATAFGNANATPDKTNRKISYQGHNEEAHIGIQDKKLQLQSNKVDMARNEYERQLSKVNLTIDMFETSYKPILNRIQDGDDAQINFVKFNLEKLSRYIEQMGKEINQRGDEIGQTVGIISSEIDLKIFVDQNKSQNPFLQREVYQEFEQTFKYGVRSTRATSIEATSQFEVTPGKSSFIDDDYIQNALNNTSISAQSNNSTSNSNNKQYGGQLNRNVTLTEQQFEIVNNPVDQFQKDKRLLEDQMNKLLKSTAITIEEKGKLIQLMHDKVMRSEMTNILKDIISPRQLSNSECLKLIADIIKFILTLFVHEQSTDYRLVYNILESSQNIYTSINKRKLFLSTLLSDHGIWQDVRIWKEMIIEIIEIKIADQTKIRKRKAKAIQDQKNQSEKNIFKKGFKQLKGMLSLKDSKHLQEAKANQNLIFNELSKFVNFFINFGLAYEQANEILINYCENFQLEQSRIHLLLTELQSNQKNTDSMFTEKELLIWSLQKRGNRIKNFGYTDSMQILGMTIKFIDNDITLRNLLMLSRDYNEVLIQEVLKQGLLRSSQTRLTSKRRVLWLKLLKIDPQYSQEDYDRAFQQSQVALSKSVSDAIEVDVNRSFNNLKQISPDNLNNILKTYAIINPNLDYCQGMNFIAGFLYLLFGKEDLSFSVMKEIIAKYSMSQLFNTELPMLKLTFYQLDRMISIKLPDLHAHFKDETINSSYFSSPYFITLFTNALQMQTTFDHSALYGWKMIFKVSLLILRENEEKLLTMPFEIMLSQVVNLPTKFLIRQFSSEEEERQAISEFDKQIKELKIPTMLIERLKTEFDQNYKISVNASGLNDSQSRISR
ncbi:rab-like gtpase activating [Stylonychia lemnae]|uniref:Rab-like gtpase activating n=1 Tax=Stylonychia lemnae TaxID=5949 RepID=A0A078A9Y6_STYLE|nr:rab-like gtpase activating [Stylonychia lemnae]|eukprot:CDW77618.1 rab-like gtpase activating [Stylonychia lemnae]